VMQQTKHLQIKLIILLSLINISHAHANLISNGGFELPSVINNISLDGNSTEITGWKTVLNGVEWLNDNLPGDGARMVDLAGGGIEQTFSTIPGQLYFLNFNLGTSNESGRDGTAHVDVTVAGSQYGADVDVYNGNGIVFNAVFLVFTATDTSTTLKFTNNQDPSLHFVYLDNVIVYSSLGPAAGTFSQPLDVTYDAVNSSKQMSGTVLGQCVYGGYCARTSLKTAHNGVDYKLPKETPVYAICNGIVKKAAKGGAIKSRFTVIDHSGCGGFNHLFAYYGHIDPTVIPGLPVTGGQQIGTVANWKTNSHLQLSLNSKFVKEFGYTNVKKATPKNCKDTTVLERRKLLDAKGWLDPILVGAQSDWAPALLKGGAAKTGCNATEQAYTDKSLPYAPWK
ncbi:MAG: peptidoglycan DD-metalloendopeptidase family protein, partial [Methylococcales bacterium]